MRGRAFPFIVTAGALIFAATSAEAAGYQFRTIAPPAGAPAGEAFYIYSLNDSGQSVVTGQAANITWNFTLVDDLYNVGTNTYTPLPADPSATTNSTDAFGLNNSGQIVGEYHPSGLGWQGFVYSGGVFTDIDPLGGVNNQAFGISNNGQIAGAEGDFTAAEAYLYSGGVYTPLVGAPFPANTSEAFDVNNSGTVVGEWGSSALNQLTNSFEYSGGVVTQLVAPGWLYTGASGINDAGVVVGGVSNDPTFDTGSGFIEQNGVYTFINVPGGTSTYVDSINNLGDIVGRYVDANGDLQMFYASPTVPEPSTWAMLLTGFAALGFAARRRAGRRHLGVA